MKNNTSKIIETHMNVDDSRQRMFCIGTTLYRNSENRFWFSHRDKQIAILVRYNVW